MSPALQGVRRRCSSGLRLDDDHPLLLTKAQRARHTDDERIGTGGDLQYGSDV